MIRQFIKSNLPEIIVPIGSIAVFGWAMQLPPVVIGALTCLYYYFRGRPALADSHRILHVILLFVLMHSIAGALILKDLPLYLIPFALVPMLTAILFNDLELTAVITLAGGLTAASASSAPIEVFFLFLVGGLSGGILVLNARKRGTIIKAGILSGLIGAVTLIIIESTWDRLYVIRPDRYTAMFAVGAASGIIVAGVLPVFEFLFSRVTNISLLELADFNHPLLQRMTMEAPGTYHHSLVVGNLSEAACAAIGANALLARVGAYYHDIGKLSKADYFSENISLSGSKHDQLAPSMSKLVIMNHVKEGVELARKYRLNDSLTEFILRHHGNSLVYYFYRRALENVEETATVAEDGFRYPGPKPNTKETAVVLLADSVEAATRALKEPTPAAIAEIVHKIINNKFIDGQLDECDLTLKDLNVIAAVFIRLLTAMYHSRISYPETKAQ